MPFLSLQEVPPGCTLPTAIGDTRVISYTYDPLSRLTSAAYSSGECYQYSYDRVSNRTAMTTTVGTTTYQYDNANRLSNVNGQNYTWDNNGNLLNDSSANYLYDRANRLISTTLSGATTLFNYNGDGVRLKQIAAGVVTTYTQDLAALLPVVLQSKTGMTTTKYLYSEGTRPLAQNSTAWEYLLPDALGSVRQINSADGYLVRTQDYEPYGSVLNSDGSASSAYGFAGEERDTYIELVFLRARYYNPELARFLSKDVWQGDYTRPQSLNGWGYTEGDPVNKVDPSGKRPKSQKEIDVCQYHWGQINAPGYCPDGTPLYAAAYEDAIRQSAHQYGLPVQVLAGLLEAELVLDWSSQNDFRESMHQAFGTWIEVFRSNPAAGYNNIHIPTARNAAEYFRDYYPDCPDLQLDFSSGDDITKILYLLTVPESSAKVAAAIVRKLADYRFGSDELPLAVDHTRLSDWDLADAVAIWHGYRYGVPGVSPDGQGFENLKEFQNRTYSLSELVGRVVKGNGNPHASALGAVPIFMRFFAMPDLPFVHFDVSYEAILARK
jgi:RHS repeat-associated protein